MTVWLSYRFIMLLSFLAKVDEGASLCRLTTCVEVGESQSVTNDRVDARHQVHMVLDFAALSWARQSEQIMAVLDIERGLPSCERPGVYLALRRRGVRSHLLEGLVGLWDGGTHQSGAVALYGAYYDGHWDSRGEPLSPAKFRFRLRTWGEGLRSSPAGVARKGQRAGVFIHMDDMAMLLMSGPLSAPGGWSTDPPAAVAAQLAGVAALGQMLDDALEWLWRHGYCATLDKFEVVLLAMGGDHGLQILDYCWVLSVTQEPH
jgi:hypothetical protein